MAAFCEICFILYVVISYFNAVTDVAHTVACSIINVASLTQVTVF